MQSLCMTSENVWFHVIISRILIITTKYNVCLHFFSQSCVFSKPTHITIWHICKYINMYIIKNKESIFPAYM